MTAIQGPIIGAELRKHRGQSGLSQFALAERAGISRNPAQYWEAY